MIERIEIVRDARATRRSGQRPQGLDPGEHFAAARNLSDPEAKWVLHSRSPARRASPSSRREKYFGQTTELQAREEASRRNAKEEERREAARAGCPKGKPCACAKALSAAGSGPGALPDSVESTEVIVAATRNWIERAVIGLSLCPFASGPYLNDRVRYCVSARRSSVGLLDELFDELQVLRDADPLACETTLLIHPHVLTDFLDYNDFLDECDAVVAELGLDGELQVASFHPRYQFSGTCAEDIENYSNRSPYPMLHLLREASVARAVASFPAVDQIGETNIATLRRLGHEGWRRLWGAA